MVWACLTVYWSGCEAGASVDSGGLKTWAECPVEGVAASCVGEFPISDRCVDVFLGDVRCAGASHSGSADDAVVGDASSSDDGTTVSEAEVAAGYETCMCAVIGGWSLDCKGSNWSGGGSLSGVSIDKDCGDTCAVVETGVDPTVALPRCLVVDTYEMWVSVEVVGLYVVSAVKTECSEVTENSVGTTEVVDVATAVCGDSGAETGDVESLGS